MHLAPQIIATGEVHHRFSGGRHRGENGTLFEWNGEYYDLVVMLNHPSDSEINEIGGGRCEVRVLLFKNVLDLLVQFDGEHWMDAPYSFWRQKRIQPDLQIPEDPAAWSADRGVGFAISLVDTADGTVKALRIAYLSRTLSSLLHEAINLQAEGGREDPAYEQIINELQAIPIELLADMAASTHYVLGSRSR